MDYGSLMARIKKSELKQMSGCIFIPVLYRNCDFTPIFFYFVNLPCDFKTKHQFAPIPLSSPSGVKFCQKDRTAHVILPLFVMPICDFTPHLELHIYIYIVYADKNDYIWSNIFGTTCNYFNSEKYLLCQRDQTPCTHLADRSTKSRPSTASSGTRSPCSPLEA